MSDDSTLADSHPIDASKVEKAESEYNQSQQNASHHHSENTLANLGQARKNFLVLIFSIATFVDICKWVQCRWIYQHWHELVYSTSVSGVAVAVAQISTDIKLDYSQIVWIVTSYSLCFAALLLFAGRLADLFPAQIVFEGGFIVLGILSLVTSFVTSNKWVHAFS